MGNIQFIESSHRYLDENGDDLISVSKFTEKFKEKQDWTAIAKKVAMKKTKEGTPTTTKDILNKWETKRDTASQIGTLFHTIREQELLDTESPVFYDVPCAKQASAYDTGGVKNSIPITKLDSNTVYPELMIYDTDYMICGQSDKVIVVDDKIHIWDYKTDAEITFNAFSSQWVKPRRLLGPLSHIEECNGNIYSIKMSIYMYLLWKANKGRFKPGDLIIEHVHLKRDPENDNIPMLDENGRPIVLKIEQIKLPYRKKEVMEMLETLKTN